MVIHTGDFKIDQTPIDGDPMDVHRLAELGSAGVLALLADSTNVDRKGFSGSEVDVTDAFEEIFTRARARSSSRCSRRPSTGCRSWWTWRRSSIGAWPSSAAGWIDNSETAQRLGYLRIPAGVQIRDTEAATLPAQDVVCICTGSQGEPQAALPRIAINDHRHVRLEPDDVVVFSAREIPGNEKAIGRVMNHIARRGAEVIYDGIKHVHVSGHGSEEELKLVLSLVRPRYFVPIHGEYRQLARHARIASPGVPGYEGAAGRERRRDPVRRRRRADRRQGSGRPGADRRHPQRRGRRRGPARSSSPFGRRPGRAGRGHRTAVRDARRDAGRDHPGVRADARTEAC